MGRGGPHMGDGPAPPDDDPAVVAVAALFTDDRVEWMGIGNVLFARTAGESVPSPVEETLVEPAVPDPFTAAPSRRKAGVSLPMPTGTKDWYPNP